jgi:chromosome partitioning protein
VRQSQGPLIVAAVQRKGGAAKTTTIVNLAGELHARGLDLVLVDADPQASAVAWAATGMLGFPVVPMPIENGDVRSWAHRLNHLPARLVMVDTPPQPDAVLGACTAVSHLVLVPCGPSGLDLEATRHTLSIVRAVRQRRRQERPRAVIVPARVSIRTLEGQHLVEELRAFGEPVAAGLSDRRPFVRSFAAGQTVDQYAPESAAHVEIARLADEVLETLARPPAANPGRAGASKR